MNILGHISRSLEKLFRVKIFKFLDADAVTVSGNLIDHGSRIQGGKNPDPGKRFRIRNIVVFMARLYC